MGSDWIDIVNDPGAYAKMLKQRRYAQAIDRLGPAGDAPSYGHSPDALDSAMEGAPTETPWTVEDLERIGLGPEHLSLVNKVHHEVIMRGKGGPGGSMEKEANKPEMISIEASPQEKAINNAKALHNAGVKHQTAYNNYDNQVGSDNLLRGQAKAKVMAYKRLQQERENIYPSGSEAPLMNAKDILGSSHNKVTEAKGEEFERDKYAPQHGLGANTFENLRLNKEENIHYPGVAAGNLDNGDRAFAYLHAGNRPGETDALRMESDDEYNRRKQAIAQILARKRAQQSGTGVPGVEWPNS